jgi:hypothetical protein
VGQKAFKNQFIETIILYYWFDILRVIISYGHSKFALFRKNGKFDFSAHQMIQRKMQHKMFAKLLRAFDRSFGHGKKMND